MVKIEPYFPSRHDLSQVREVLGLTHAEELQYQRQERALTVAVDKGNIVGALGFDSMKGEILHLAVDPAYRGQHVARHLIEYITGVVIKPFIQVVTDLECVPFYEACGFISERMDDGRYHCMRVNRTKRCC